MALAGCPILGAAPVPCRYCNCLLREVDELFSTDEPLDARIVAIFPGGVRLLLLRDKRPPYAALEEDKVP